MKKILYAAFLLLTTLVFISCSGGSSGTSTSAAPVIQSLSVNGAPASPGGTITATVNAQSTVGLALSYSWSVSDGWIIASVATSSIVTVTAPISYATAGTLTVTVTDTRNMSAVSTIALSTVSDAGPVIQSLSVTGAPASPGGIITATVNAQSTEGLALTYLWAVSTGWTISSGETTSVVTITAPNSYAAAGMAIVAVSDTQNMSAISTIALSTVNDTGPVIQSMSVTGVPASPGGTLTAAVNAQSSEGLALTYSWAVTDGWIILSGATSSIVTISAPGSYAATGTATVTVNDILSMATISTVALSTENDSAPVIDSMSIYSQPVITSANLLVIAHDLNGDALTYSWTIGGIENILTGTSVTWNSPGIPGNYTVSVAVSDGTITTKETTSVSIGSTSPWPRFGRDIQGTRLSPVDTSANTGLITKWTYTMGNTVGAPAIGADGTVYVGSFDGNLYAINPGGTLKWTYNASIGSMDSSPAIDSNGTVYIGSCDGKLHAVNSNGTLKWTYTISGCASSSVIGADGTIYVGSDDNKLYAINSNGTLKWTYTTGGGVRAAAAIGADGTVYTVSFDNYLYAINPDGTLKWSYKTWSSMGDSPAVSVDGTVYVGSYNNNLYAINSDGTLKWIYTTSGVDSSPAIGADGTIYIGSTDNSLYAINPNGTLKWSYATGSYVLSSAAIGGDGIVYVGSDDGKLYAFNSNGTLKWTYNTGYHVWSSPAIGADGSIYFASGDFKLYAIQ